MEVIVLALASGFPWLWRASIGRLFVYVALAALLLLWAARLLLQRKFDLRKCPVSICLGALFLAGTWQLMALPAPVIRVLAPANAEVYQRMLPERQETLVEEEPGAGATSEITISLYAHGTREVAMDFLAAFLLFTIARNNLSPVRGLSRLSACTLCNGALIVFVQFFLSFQPAHDAAYLEMSLGLGVGLLYSRLYENAELLSEPSKGRGSYGCEPWMSVRRAGRFDWIVPLIGSGVLTLVVGLCRILSPVAVVLMGLAGTTCTLLVTSRSRAHLVRTVGLAAAIAGLGMWLAWDSLAAAGAAWSRVLAFSQEFPLWGTGLGTFAQVATNQGFFDEAELASSAAVPSVLMTIAVEGGALHLVLSVLAIGLVFLLGYRSVRRPPLESSLALGVLLGFSALVLHGCLAPGQPAVWPLLTVACAYLCGLSDGTKSRLVKAKGTLAALGGATLLLLLAVILSSHAWRAYKIRNLIQEARDVDTHEGTDRLKQLEEAMPLAKTDAEFHRELALAHQRCYEKKLASIERRSHFLEATQIADLLGAGWFFGGPFPRTVAWQRLIDVPRLRKASQDYLKNEHLVPALQHWLEARTANPLNPEFQWWIAASHHQLRQADAREAYLARAMSIAPCDPRVFYQAGEQEMLAGQVDKAFQNWKRALELSDAFLGPILEHARFHLTPNAMIHRILANRPGQVLLAADYLFADVDSKQRSLFLKRVVALFAEEPHPSARDFHVAATAYATLGPFSKARDAFEQALAREPRQTGWRYELALFLYEHGKYQESRAELLAILEQRPDHNRARNLLSRVSDRLAN
jgi:tetratricopeptide (TPR) repeat protein